MPKTKISEFSATPANNTDIDSINIAEGCSPSGINDAIRELMAQLKDFQTGAAGDSFNGPVGTTTAAAGAFTTLSASGAVTLSGGTANGVAYLNGSKVVTSGSALTFDGTTFKVNTDGIGCNITRGTSVGFLYHSGNAGAADLTLQSQNGSVRLLTEAGSGGTLKMVVEGAEVGRFTSTGLGIGTSSPSYKLSIAGSSATSSNLLLTHNTDSTGAYSRIRFQFAEGNTSIASEIRNIQRVAGASGSNLAFFTENNSGTLGEVLRLDSSGNLGLGVTDPATYGGVFVARATSGANFSVRTLAGIGGSGTGVGLDTLNNGASSVADLGIRANTIQFRNSGSEAARIDSSGRLQVGTTSAYESARVTVSSAGSNGVSSTQASSGGYCFLSNAVSNGGTYYFHLFKANGTDTGSITSNGTTTTYATTSDYRLKTVIGAVTGHGARIDALEPIEYTWNSNGLRTRGFLAHKFQEVYADSVTGTKDAIDAEGNPQYQSMQAGSSEVIADLVAEIQSLRKRLADAGIA